MSRRKCSFWCSHASRPESLVFWWRRRVYGGSCKTCPCGMFQTVKIGGRLARNAGFDVPTCLVSSLWFSCGFAVSMGEAAKPLLFECFQAGCQVALRGRRGTFWHSNLFDDVRKNSKLEEVSYRKCCFFCIHVSCRESLVFLWRRRVYGGSWKNIYTLHTLHFTLHTLHPTLHTLHFTLYTIHSTLHTLHFTLHAFHFTLLTPHFTLHTPHFTLHTPHSTLYTPHSTLYTLYTPHSTLYTPHSLLDTPHSTLYTFHSTLQTGNKGNMYKTVQINSCRKVLFVTA